MQAEINDLTVTLDRRKQNTAAAKEEARQLRAKKAKEAPSIEWSEFYESDSHVTGQQTGKDLIGSEDFSSATVVDKTYDVGVGSNSSQRHSEPE